MRHSMTRREFVAKAVAGVAAVTVAGGVPAMGQAGGKGIKIIAFSKPFQQLNPEQTAELVAEVGWDGIECPVRAKGQVEPEKVEDDLPKMVEAMKKRGKEVTIITTDVKEVTPLNERVLRTAAKLGIRKYRMVHVMYTKEKPLEEQLRELAVKLKDVAALNKELGIQAGYQNHSGADYVGGPVWDIYSVMKQFDPKQMSIHFDIGHATLEGGKGWNTQARLARPILGAVYIKDFYWEKANAGWRTKWCPVGEGMIKRSFIEDLKKSGYEGPISQHHEYFAANESRESMVQKFKKDLETLKGWLG